MKFLSFLLNIVSTLFLTTLLFFAIFTVATNSPLFGKFSSYLIQSGSMEPTIMTGDIIVVQSAKNYSKNETVTFKSGGRIVTHRIIDSSELDGSEIFTTKGDANRTEDEGRIPKELILGKVIFVLPKLGFLVHFARTPWGLIFLIIIPAIALIVDQLVHMGDKK